MLKHFGKIGATMITNTGNKMEEVTQAMAASGSASAAASGGKALLSGIKTMAIFTFLGGVFMFVLTMAFQPPKSVKEVVLAFTSLIVCGFCGSSFMIFYFKWNLPAGFDGDSIRFGLAMPCAALGWLIIKSWFKWCETSGVNSVASLFTALSTKLQKMISGGSGE